ncbi:MAG: rhomboid family intramembrane serine protease [Terricaulis sp.]
MSDEHYERRLDIPVVVLALAGVIVAAFVVTQQWDLRAVNVLATQYGIVPLRYAAGGPEPYSSIGDAIVPLFAHVFVHGGILHIAMNMFAYFQAAPFLARRMGGLRFLALFFLAAIGGAIGYILIDLNSAQPAVGASGAICGVFGAFFLAVRPTPQAAIADPQVRNAMLSFLGINVVLMAFLNLPIAWQAHLGGFVVGAASYLVLRPPARAAGPWG